MHNSIQRMSPWTSCMLCLVAVSYGIDFHSASSMGDPGHHVHRTWIPTTTSFGDNPKIVRTAATRTMFRTYNRKWKLLVERSQVTFGMTQVTNLWFSYSESMRSEDLILNTCSHEDHTHTNSLWKWAFIHTLYAFVPQNITNITYIERAGCFLIPCGFAVLYWFLLCGRCTVFVWFMYFKDTRFRGVALR
jgi:hypothetical protein